MSEIDIELLRRWRRGEPDAGNELVDRHFHGIYRYFRRRLPDAELAKDLTQKTFVTALEIFDRLERDASFRAFMLGIARNVLRQDARASSRRDARHQRWGEQPISTATSPSQQVAERQEHRVLLRAIGRLPEDLRHTVQLHYWECLTTAEIGQVLGVAAGTVKWRLSKARTQLRELIEDEPIGSGLIDTTIQGLDGWASDLRNLLGNDEIP